ncbi:uncharacterized protein LACBIDRAFT_307657 [Laccaria bicolor S238N-H82]|uniref:Predicted protein n=1 Tax=Laccaria bicolor (strain S238N-H82 / ATCC MYA-4686) TaxID=486041 RepID=B0DQP2_LACBS|nr:uncharacterized protein LACBIDRAFT_307657 [Laccaria bicolor S238N-H82]EDR03068.1 predicted protein [Laccaria bicolor S238N-H82]|eukprot:XP_001886209.1 predicted protein [Laccaria bicolor S238N-H82]
MILNRKFSALLVQPKQLFMIAGHLPRLGQLMHDRTFVKLIKHMHVDEAHFIYSAGMEHYGLPAFRDACGISHKTWERHSCSSSFRNATTSYQKGNNQTPSL